MAFNNLPKGPQDYLNFHHTDKDGNIWLDGNGKPISLQQNLTGQTSKISPSRALGINRDKTKDSSTP